MATAIRFGLLGLGASGAYALLALGLVAIHRGSGVVNFAHGAFAMVGGFVYWDLTNHGWHLWPAAIVAVVIVTALGFVVSVGLMQRLRHSSPLARVIGTLAVSFALTSAGVLLWGGGPQTVASILPQVPVKFDVFGVKVTAISDRIIIIGLVLFVALLLSLFYRFTVVGLAMHASAENEGAAAGLGWSPNRLATSSWVLGAALAGIAGVLIAPIATISVETTTLFVVPALAAALFASFTSVWG